jgi:peptidoglycan/LPS O-acetylase OafA/YrhL
MRKRTSRSRLLRSALAIVVLTWVPAALGGALHLSLARSWGVASGYAGLSWALPAFLIGLAATRAARDRRLPGQRALGVVAGVAAAIVLVIGAASVVGG